VAINMMLQVKTQMKLIQRVGLLAALLVATPMRAQTVNQAVHHPVNQRATQGSDQGIKEARVSVERLLKLSLVDALAKTPAEQAVATLLARERVDMYVTGVRDLGEGRQWCIYRQNILPHEVVDRVLGELRSLKGDALHGNAAHAVADVLKKQYPCQP
jgi:Rap1a immunity proteins